MATKKATSARWACPGWSPRPAFEGSPTAAHIPDPFFLCCQAAEPLGVHSFRVLVFSLLQERTPTFLGVPCPRQSNTQKPSLWRNDSHKSLWHTACFHPHLEALRAHKQRFRHDLDGFGCSLFVHLPNTSISNSPGAPVAHLKKKPQKYQHKSKPNTRLKSK